MRGADASKTTPPAGIPVPSRAEERPLMMRRSPARRAAVFGAFALAFPVLLMGCPKKQPPVADAGEPAPPASSTSVAELVPLTDDDAGDGAPEAAAGPKK